MADQQLTTWVAFGLSWPDGDPNKHRTDNGVILTTGFRYHVGPLTAEVSDSIVHSLRREAKRAGTQCDEVVMYPLAGKPTTNGHQRYVNGGYVDYTWMRRKGRKQ